MVNVFQCNESASEIRRPILNTNFDPLKFRYNPSETKVNGSFLLKFDNDSSCNIISLETKAEEYLQTLGRSIRYVQIINTIKKVIVIYFDYVNCSRSNSCNLSPDSITKTKTNKKTIKKRVVKKKRGKKQSSKRIQEWKRLSQKLDEIEQELDHKDLKEKVKKDTFSNDFENFSWTTYKNSDIIDSEKDCNEEKKEIGTKISKYGLKQKEKACFYKNSKFKSNEFNEDNIQIKNSKRRRIMTFEEDNYSNLNSVIEQVEEIKNIRKKSTNEGEIITLRKCSNPTKLSFGTTMNTVSDKCNSVINSPNYFDSTNSEALQDNVTSESSFNQLRKKRKMKYKLRNLKINPDRKLSCGSVSLPMSSMLAILDGLKEIEEEMDK